MLAMMCDGATPRLREANVSDPSPSAGWWQIGVHACGVCRTDLHLVDGELANPKPCRFRDTRSSELCAGWARA
ncbi:hypothetical protein BLAT2472_20380 [Burkholderia latens]